MDIVIACIGSGNMGFALMKAAGAVEGTSIGFSDADGAKAESAARALGAALYASNGEAVMRGDYVFLAVKPQALAGVLAETAAALRERLAAGKPPVLVSMAAGWSIEKIQAALAGGGTDAAAVPVARIMPNTPALISRGMIALAASPAVPAEKIAGLETILSGAGVVERVAESYMDAVTGLSGSGPAFVYLFIEALADGGVKAGLPRDKALRFAAQTVLGSAAMVQETGRHPGELKDMVCSPGGTTIAGVSALENGAFRGAVINAVEAAWRRSTELG
ncbi:MAG: pyrroline-5-carboxylate reductase [Treponema sp.]|jgi:pyrroline-5-carboxylate reductase|nr:pyrroline-5-carboxylate reductase [Treponema sp.]